MIVPIDDFAMACQAKQAGDYRQAERHCRQFLDVNAGSVDGWTLLAEALQAQGKHAETAAAYRQVLRLQPDHVGALVGLGIVLAELGNLDEVVRHWQEAVLRCPGAPQLHHNLGVALAQQGRPAKAVRSLERALALQPDYAEAHFNLGNVCRTLGWKEDAVASYRRALAARPDHSGACNNLGLTQTELRRWEEAVVLLSQAVRLRPTMVEAHNNLGMALTDLGRFAEAEECYQEALRLNPAYYEAHANLGSLYKEQGRLDEALASYQMALWLQPDSASAHWNRSLAWLQKGDYENGWREYEWRWRRTGTRERQFPRPRWDGSPLAGRTILLWSEQGLGDTIQFVRYAAALQEQGAKVVLECPGILVTLLSGCRGVNRIVAEGEPLPDFDVHAPLMSLPAILDTNLQTVPAEVPYLAADQERLEKWGKWVGRVSEFKVGIAWQGNPHQLWDHHRSVPLSQFAPLAQVPGARLFSLQKVFGTEQIASAGFAVTELNGDWDLPGAAFTDTAAVMTQLDLVVTVDTATAHLAGALGVPTWLALSVVSDWRWLRDREDSPWYPTMRLFRQRQVGEWAPVFERMAGELERLVGKKSRNGLVRVEMAPGELFDKISILEIKSERITDAKKLCHVRDELTRLRRARDADLPGSAVLDRLTTEIKAVNDRLWQIEDDIRICEQSGDWGPRFIELARSVYRSNDERTALKREINDLLGAPFSEQKCYQGSAIMPAKTA